MTKPNKTVTARKFGSFEKFGGGILELTFAFNAATKDGAEVESTSQMDLDIRSGETVGPSELKDIEVFMEQEVTPLIQGIFQSIVSGMSAADIEEFNSTGTSDAATAETFERLIENAADDFVKASKSFDDKFGHLVQDHIQPMNFKPRLKGPKPQ